MRHVVAAGKNKMIILLFVKIFPLINIYLLDHARVSVQDAFARFNKIHPPPFYCIFVAADCWEVRGGKRKKRGK